MLNRLFDTSNVIAQAVKTRLNFSQGIGELSIICQMLFNTGIERTLFCNSRFDLNFQMTDFFLVLFQLSIQALPTQRVEICIRLTLFRFELTVLFCSYRLSLEML